MWPLRWTDVAHLAADGVVLAATTSTARRGLPDWERDLFVRIASLPDAATPALWLPMQFGSLWGPVATSAAVWVRTKDARRASGTLVVGVAAWQAAKLVKSQVRRGRPASLIDDAVRRSGTPTDGLGFPSGHSAVAFGVAAVLRPHCGSGGRIALDALASTVGIARIDVAAHLPLDVVGGAALGDLLGSVWNLTVGVPGGGSEVTGEGSRRIDRSSVRSGCANGTWSRARARGRRPRWRRR
jgi:undecaprenyl-diphosphatase